MLWAPPAADPVAVAAYVRARREVDRLLRPDECVTLPPDADGGACATAAATAAYGGPPPPSSLHLPSHHTLGF